VDEEVVKAGVNCSHGNYRLANIKPLSTYNSL